MRIIERGVLNRGETASRRAVSAFPAVTLLPGGTLLASYRVGTTKDAADGTVELRRSSDGGRTWSEPATPFETTVEGRRGSLRVVYVTQIADHHHIAAALWVDRQAFPGQPLFNEATEGCLPMAILLADSHDLGVSWTPWRIMPVPNEFGPPSLTNPILHLPSGRLAVSIESNKPYKDTSKWFQRVAYVYSEDRGTTWGPPVTVCRDPSARLFHWDQRAGVCPDGQIVTFTWTYDRQANRYLNVQRRVSADEGTTWSAPEDMGFADQPSKPAMLPDGRVVVAWVDRFQTHSIRARWSAGTQSLFHTDTEVVLHELAVNGAKSGAGDSGAGELLADMQLWSYGLPFAEALPDGNVIVLYYEGTPDCMQISWVRLAL